MKETKFDLYQHITDTIIAALEKGVVPWQKPWTAATGVPRSVHGRPYGGINQILLGLACMEYGWKHPVFITLPQANKLGGMVRKGERSSMVVFWKTLVPKEYKDSPADCPRQSLIWMLRFYRVFNIAQIDNLPLSVIPQDTGEGHAHDPIAACEEMVEAMPKRPDIRHGGGVACYSPDFDRVTMPELNSFTTPEGYYNTLFHELVHSTGHKSRLDRKDAFAGNFGSDPYAKEELVAEMGAAFLSAKAGISPGVIENSSAYIASWIKRIKDDNKFIVSASARAKQAAESIAPTPQAQAVAA